MNNGRDSIEYLRSGARVVAVEGNPVLARAAEGLFAPFVRSGQMVVVNALLVEGVADDVNQTMPFYVHVHRDEWSSLDMREGCRREAG